MSASRQAPPTAWFQPLRRKLPLLISALLLAVIGAYSWFAHDRLHRALEDAARDRLSASGERLGALLGESAARFAGALRQLAADQAVVAVVETARGSTRLELAAAALQMNGAAPRLVSRALWSADCTLLALVPANGPTPACDAAAPPVRGDTARVGPLSIHDDSILYSIAVPVRGGTSGTAGLLVETRTIGGGNSSMIEGLIGEDVSMYLGNADGAFWTNLVRQVPAPPAIGGEGKHGWGADRNGTPVLGVLTAVPGTPWHIVLTVPRRAVAAPARQLLQSIGFAALGCLVVGALGAWMIGRRVTGPIETIASAATGIAAGDYSRRVPVSGRDEMAHLARAFNDMAARVESASAALQSHAMALEEQVQLARDARRDTALVRSLLEDVLASAPVGVALLDTSLRYVKANAAMAALNALSADDHIGNTPAQVHPVMGELLEPVLLQVRASGETLANRHITGAAAAGQPRRHWLVTGFPVRDTEGAVSGVGLIVADTTAHHDLEAQLLHSQKMEAVGRLAGGVAHDFNNLLTVILSYSSMAVESLGEDEELRRDMIEIRDAALRAAALTRQLLAFSRNQALAPQQINLNETVRGMERLLEPLLGREVTLDLQLADDLGDVFADPGQMEQVIMNLVVNARDAMPDGGRIVVATANIMVTSEHPLVQGDGDAAAGECVMLTVCDTGTGMPEDVVAHIFEPFFTTKPAGKGTGLGLSTVYGIVTQSGGDVRVEQNAGPGTTFAVRLPRVG